VPAAASSVAAGASSAQQRGRGGGQRRRQSRQCRQQRLNSVRKVSANAASEEEITAALTATGVTNPGRLAEEVVEYPAYPPTIRT
jgi:hypothetical protein